MIGPGCTYTYTSDCFVSFDYLRLSGWFLDCFDSPGSFDNDILVFSVLLVTICFSSRFFFLRLFFVCPVALICRFCKHRTHEFLIFTFPISVLLNCVFLISRFHVSPMFLICFVISFGILMLLGISMLLGILIYMLLVSATRQSRHRQVCTEIPSVNAESNAVFSNAIHLCYHLAHAHCRHGEIGVS